MRNSTADLFEIDPGKFKAAAEFLCERLKHEAKPKTPEMTLRIAFQGAVHEVAERLAIRLDWRDEFHMIEGRADTVYGALVIEYEPPCSLRASNSASTN